MAIAEAPAPTVHTAACTVDAAILKTTVARLKPVVNARCAVSALTCLRVDATDSQIQLTATNLDTTLIKTIPGVVDTPGSLLVPVSVLDKILAVHPKGTVTIAGDDVEGTVTGGNASLSFRPDDLTMWPTTPAPVGRSVTLNLDALAEVLPATSPDESRPILTGVNVEHGVYAATNSYWLAVAYTGDDTGDQFLLPRETVGFATKRSAAIKGDRGTVTAVVGTEHITVTFDDDTTLVGRLIEGEFPPYKKLIPKTSPHTIEITDTFLADLKKVTRLTAVKNEPVRIGDYEGCIELTIRSDGQVARTVTPGTAAPFTVAFNPGYLGVVLAGTTSNRILVTDTLKPALVDEPAPYGRRVRLIMPVRVA